VVFNHFTEKFLALAEEELSGVKSTILNILFFYQHPDIAAVFGQPRSTVDFSLTDQGKIFCCSIPQRFDAERGFLNTLMKIAWYAHIKSRFNLSEEDLAKSNLNVLWADEAQRVVTKSELGMADHNQVDQVREAKGCAIFSTQTERSFVPPLGKDIKNTLVDNLGNEIAFCQTNQEDAEILAKRIGERTLEKTSRTVSQQSNGFSTSRSYQEKEEPFLKPHVLRNLKKHRHGSECVVRHCEKGFQRTVLPFTHSLKK
jgi:type IV secretory pathway TraG/TraD family ATPase VirD4